MNEDQIMAVIALKDLGRTVNGHSVEAIRLKIISRNPNLIPADAAATVRQYDRLRHRLHRLADLGIIPQPTMVGGRQMFQPPMEDMNYPVVPIILVISLIILVISLIIHFLPNFV